MEQLHLCPKQDKGGQAGGVSECPGLEVHPGLLPHGLPVVGQGGRGIAGEQKVVYPIPLAVGVLLQEVVSGEGLIVGVAPDVVGHHGPGLIGVGQFELEHGLEQGGVGRVLHDPLGLQSSGSLGRRELLCRAGGSGGVLAPLEGVGDADDLPGLLIHLFQVGHVLLHAALQIEHADHGHVRGATRADDLHVVLVHLDGGRIRQGDVGAGSDQLVDDLGFNPVGCVLLVCDLVDVAVPQELPVHAHVFLENDGVDVRLVKWHSGGLHLNCHQGQAQLVHLVCDHLHRLRTGDHVSVSLGDGVVDLLKLLLCLLPVAGPAVGADLAPAGLGALRLSGHDHRAAAHSGRDAVQGRADGLHVVRRLQRAALGAPSQPSGLIVLHVLQGRVVDPGVQADAAFFVAVVGDVLGNHVVGCAGLHGALDIRLGLALVPHVHAVLALDVLLGLWDFENDVVHVLNAGVHAVLGHNLLGVDGGYGQLTDGCVGAALVVPLHQKGRASLDGHRALLDVVDGLKGEPVQLVAQHVLNELGPPLVLLPAGRDLWLRDVGVHLGLNQLRAEVAHVGRALFPGPVGQRGDPVASLVEFLPPIHAAGLCAVCIVVAGQPLLPQVQLLRLFAFSGQYFHLRA